MKLAAIGSNCIDFYESDHGGKKLIGTHKTPHLAVADSAVLAEDAAQVAAAEKDGSRTARAADGRLLPHMKIDARHQKFGGSVTHALRFLAHSPASARAIVAFFHDLFLVLWGNVV